MVISSSVNSLSISSVSGLELWQWREEAREKAHLHNISLDEVDWLIQAVTNLDRLALYLELFKSRPQIEVQMPLPTLTQLWQRRVHDRLPVQYLVGVAPWRHFSLMVSPAVLIPRPETEDLIDLAVAAAQGALGMGGGKQRGHGEKEILAKPCGSVRQGDKGDLAPSSSLPLPPNSQSLLQQHWVDLGTGSGAIALGLAEVFSSATIHAVDCSSAALAIAQKNALNLGLADRIKFYQGSWWRPLEALKGQVCGMVANPPYIPSDMVPTLQPEVADHEPWLALDGGADGLECIRHLIETGSVYLQPGGIWLVEMMAGQADAVTQMLQNQGSYCQIQIHADLAGIERFALAFKKI